MTFAAAEQIANAVLYEGYALYPYRPDSRKNIVRWQFGIVAPREYAEASGADPWFAQTECLVEPDDDPVIDVRVRFLEVRGNSNDPASGWDEGHERAVDISGVHLTALAASPCQRELTLEPAAAVGHVRMHVTRAGRFVKLQIRLENTTPASAALDRRSAMRRSFVGTHTLITIARGRFVSMVDPPADAAEAVASCVNLHTWPVLVGDRSTADTILSSPIILYDYPSIAPESPGDLFDATEIDEILSLRIMTLTDEEKALARASDPRARAVIDRVDDMPPAVFARLHGTMRDVRALDGADAEAQWRNLLNPSDQPSPESATIEVNGGRVSKGSRVIVRPKRRADPMDMFVAGRVGRVEGVYTDVDGRTLAAIVLDDDPSGDLHAEFGRFMYYGPEEIELVE